MNDDPTPTQAADAAEFAGHKWSVKSFALAQPADTRCMHCGQTFDQHRAVQGDCPKLSPDVPAEVEAKKVTA